MVTLKIRIAGLALMFAAGGCAKSVAPAPSRLTAAEYPVIVRIVGRTETITVSSGPAGPVYSAQAGDGTRLISNATREQLRYQHPAIYQRLDSSFAGPVGLVSDR